MACPATGQGLIEAREQQKKKNKDANGADRAHKASEKQAKKEREMKAKKEQKEEEKQRRSAEKGGGEQRKEAGKAVRVNQDSDKRDTSAKRPRIDDKENWPPDGALGRDEHHSHIVGMLLIEIDPIHDELAMTKLFVIYIHYIAGDGVFMSEPYSTHGRQQQAVPQTVFDGVKGLPYHMPHITGVRLRMHDCFYVADRFRYVPT